MNYTPPEEYEGIDTVFVMDSAGNMAVCHVEIVGVMDVFSMYTGPDNLLDEAEMQSVITDFLLQGDSWLTPEAMFRLIETYLGN